MQIAAEALQVGDQYFTTYREENLTILHEVTNLERDGDNVHISTRCISSNTGLGNDSTETASYWDRYNVI